MENQNKPSLMVHEWLAIAIMIGFLGMLTMISVINSKTPLTYDKAAAHPIVNPYIKVTIEGALENPGVHQFSKGTRVKEALEQVKLLPEADLRRLNLEGKLRKNQVLRIPKIDKITVYLQGAVEKPGAIEIPKGTRLNQLENYIKVKTNADREIFKKKRVLKASEIVIIPEK